jgi:DUF1680 family protein
MKNIAKLIGRQFKATNDPFYLIYKLDRIENGEVIVTWERDNIKDEIEYTKQDVLKYIENGDWILLGATTKPTLIKRISSFIQRSLQAMSTAMSNVVLA